MPTNIIPSQTTNFDQMLDGNYLHGESAGGTPYLKESFESIVNNVNTLNSESNVTPGASKIGVKTNAYTNFAKSTNDVAAALEGIDDELSIINARASGSADSLSIIEGVLSVEQAGITSLDSSSGLIDSHVGTPWSLVISGTISAGALSFTCVNPQNLINIIPKRTYILRDAATTANGKREEIKVNSVTYGAETITVNVSVAIINGYAASAVLSSTDGEVSLNRLCPLSTAVSTHESYTRTTEIKSANVERKLTGSINVSWRSLEKFFFVSSFTSDSVIQITGTADDAALMPQYYETSPSTVSFKVALIKIDKDGDVLVSPESIALGYKNFKVFNLSAATTHSGGVVTINLNEVNPVYGTGEATETFNNVGVTQLKWIVLPITTLKEISATDQDSFESWVSVEIQKILLCDFLREGFSDAVTYSCGPYSTSASDALFANNWYYWNYENGSSGPSADGARIIINSRTYYNTRTFLYRNLEGVYGRLYNQPVIVTGKYGMTIGGQTRRENTIFAWGVIRAIPSFMAASSAGGIYVVVGAANSSGAPDIIYVYENSTLLVQANVGISNPNTALAFSYKVEATKNNIKVKIWLTSSTEPSTYQIDYTKPSGIFTLSYSNFCIGHSGQGNDTSSCGTFDNIVIQVPGPTFTMKSSVDLGTPVNANKISQKTKLYHFSKAASIPLEYGGAAILS